jgi:2-polyprenyl-3-methyl-5-hydroxy-6-metoxy-1,4-benzoquinol methylase
MTTNAEPPVDTREDFDLIADPFVRIEKSGRFSVDDIPLITETYIAVGNVSGTLWDHFRGKHLTLPDWFRSELDPMSGEYFAQQMRLWKALAAVDREYSAHLDEAEEWVADVDAIRRPGFYIWRTEGAIAAASDHVIATAMLMKHSGLEAGMWALEYGAGFAQTALAFARMGVNVDTVDISATFCRYVQEQAEFFRVNLTPFRSLFGDNPRGGKKYDLIWFYESFHHCVDFKSVVGRLKHHLNANGKILLAGEPIVRREYAAVPYPWGLRLESEVVATMRRFHWCELGFSEDFIVNLFINNGYIAERIDCPISTFGIIYSFTSRGAQLDLDTHWLPTLDEEGWHATEPNGRWTRGASTLALDQTESFDVLEIAATNHHPKVHPVMVAYGGMNMTVNFEPGEHKNIRIDAKIKSPKISFSCEAIVPGTPELPSNDTRALGIFVHSIAYI